MTVKTFTSTGSWLCPPGVTSVKVEIRAPGGGSGGITTDTFAIGGGAGGQYVIKNSFTVVPGTTYTVTIGSVGAAGSATGPTNGGTGGGTWFSSNDGSGVVAKGGAPSLANSRTGGVGSTTGGVGDTVHKGGDGGTSSGTTGGGGGEGGCSDKDGGSGGAPTAGSGGDGGDGGTGASNGVGGAPSNYGGGGAGSASTSTTNRAGRAGAAGNIVSTYTTPTVSNITDNFDDNSINAALWTSEVNASATVAESSQHLVITPANSTADSYGLLYSKENYNLTGGSVFAAVEQVGAAGTDNQLEARIDGSNYIRMNKDDTDTLYAIKNVAGGGATVVDSIAYNATTMKWWRLREASGTTYWEYSADGLSWTELTHAANPIAVTSLQVRVQCYEHTSTATPGAAIFDNFNISPAAALTGTATASITEADIVSGGKTIILTLTGANWIAAGAGSFDLQRANIIAGLTSAQSEALGWNNVVKVLQGVSGVVRTSDTVVTITLDAQATYNITATETITATIPATALAGAVAIVASPTFSITATGGGSTAVQDVIQSNGILVFPR